MFPFLKKMPVVRRLFDRPKLTSADPSRLNRTIYLYWDSGLDSAPDICRMCRDSWHQHNPGWTIVELDKASAAEHLDPASLPADIEACHYADLLRVTLLQKSGGVWADATLLCLKPLDDWLPALFTQTDTFVFSNPAPDRLVSNWFIAALPDAALLRSWADASHAYWRGRKRLPLNYFWQHALWQRLALFDRAFRRGYRSMPRLSADTCHRMLFALRKGHFTSVDHAIIRQSPMQKLSHKDGIDPGHVTDVLEQIRQAGPHD